MAVGESLTKMPETRRDKRKPFEYTAAIDLGPAQVPLPCEVLDISTGGARLGLFWERGQIPDSFFLLLSNNGRVRRHCRIAWRKPNQIGVQFLKATGETVRRPGEGELVL
jgi:hypothetical protein